MSEQSVWDLWRNKSNVGASFHISVVLFPYQCRSTNASCSCYFISCHAIVLLLSFSTVQDRSKHGFCCISKNLLRINCAPSWLYLQDKGMVIWSSLYQIS